MSIPQSLKDFFNPASSTGIAAWVGTALVVVGGLLSFLCNVAAWLGLNAPPCVR